MSEQLLPELPIDDALTYGRGYARIVKVKCNNWIDNWREFWARTIDLTLEHSPLLIRQRSTNYATGYYMDGSVIVQSS
jgi:hypothetical protein